MPKRVLVAEGDSWFALSKWKKYKVFSLGFFGIKRTDVIEELEKLGYDIERVADSSHKIESMAYSNDQFDEFKDELQELHESPHAILLSGGGNDITGRALEMMLNHRKSDSYSSSQDPTKSLNDKVLEGVIDIHLREAYLKLLTKIDECCKDKFQEPNKEIPVLIHGYAYPIPDGRGFANKKSEGNFSFALFDLLDPLIEEDIPGPWLRLAFKNRGYSRLKESTKIMKVLVDRFNRMLERLCNENSRFCRICVKHVDVRSCFEENAEKTGECYMKVYDRYWDDEFHPSECGFKLIALKFDEVFRQNVRDQDNQDA